jgi:hypothetical protein
MSKSFTRTGGVAGLLGSILVLATMVLGILFPSTENASAIMYGLGALLLLVNVISLLLLRKGRPAPLAILSLVAAMLGLALIVLYALLDILSTIGIGSTEGYWTWLVVALLLTVLGISAYAITALIARALPVWVGLPFAFAGLAVILLTLVVSSGLINLGSAADTFVPVATVALMLTFFAMWGLMSLTGLRDAVDESSTSSDLAPRPGVTT